MISCGVLETPRFGRKSNFLFVPNTKVTFECNQEFVLIGDQRRSCSSDGKWDIPEYGYTECLREYNIDENELQLKLTNYSYFNVTYSIQCVSLKCWYEIFLPDGVRLKWASFQDDTNTHSGSIFKILTLLPCITKLDFCKWWLFLTLDFNYILVNFFVVISFSSTFVLNS